MALHSPKQFSEVLAELINQSPLTQREIALRLGYTQPNIITMFKKGQAKVPLTKIAPMADVLGVDPLWLLRLAISEYEPGLWDALTATIGFAVTNNEVGIVKGLRVMTANGDPRLDNLAQQLKLEELGRALLN